MRRSIDRILVSHAGNLPRPDDLTRLLIAGESERVALNKRLPGAVAEVVERQIACGVDVVKPEVLTCLGATAARALLGSDFRLMQQRGRFFPTRWAAKTIATLHPSAVLRGQDDAEQARLYAMLRDDLRLVAAA